MGFLVWFCFLLFFLLDTYLSARAMESDSSVIRNNTARDVARRCSCVATSQFSLGLTLRSLAKQGVSKGEAARLLQ
jgi:hypothetical protein